VTRLAQVANAVWPASGGVRVVVHALGEEEVRSGGERLLLRPGPLSEIADGGERTIAGPRLPGSGTYRILLRRAEVRQALEEFSPDVLQVHDQTTLTWLGNWARSAGVPSVLFAHDHTGHLMADLGRLPKGLAQVAGRSWSRRLTDQFDAVICASQFSAAPFLAAEAPNVHVVPFGVDLNLFSPRRNGPLSANGTTSGNGPTGLAQAEGPWRPGVLKLIFAGRFWPEKSPMIALDALAALQAAGVAGELVMIGDGPLAPALRRRIQAEGLPAQLLGHFTDRERLANLVAAADVCLSPGPRETFGLSVLEAMASGTPVVVSRSGAAQELISPGAGLAANTPAEYAAAIYQLAGNPEAPQIARRRAEAFSWSATFAAVQKIQDDLRARQVPAGTR
jgi:alpha-1,6-mannosyltransferase